MGETWNYTIRYQTILADSVIGDSYFFGFFGRFWHGSIFIWLFWRLFAHLDALLYQI